MIQTQALVKRYRGRAVVDGVDLAFEPGRLHALVGPNGAGKSTLLSLIGGLIKPDGGQVLVDDADVGRWDRRSLSRRLSMLLQNQRTDLRLTVEELVALGRYPHSGPRPGPEDHHQVERALEFMELGELRGALVPELSGGERQRAYLALTLAQDTEAVLLDEPLNNLDPAHAVRILRLVRRLVDELGKTVVVVVHDLNAAAGADEVWALAQGKLIGHGPPEVVLEPGLLGELYGLPFRVERRGGRLLCHHEWPTDPA